MYSRHQQVIPVWLYIAQKYYALQHSFCNANTEIARKAIIKLHKTKFLHLYNPSPAVQLAELIVPFIITLTEHITFPLIISEEK